MKKKLKILLAILIFITALVVFIQSAWDSYKYNFYLKKLPASLEVTKIIYNKHVAVGYAPSGHESGIVVYELPETIAKRIQTHGISFFSENSPVKGDENTKYFQKWQWQKTPIQLNKKWMGPTMGGEPLYKITKPQIGTFVNRWAHPVSIDEEIQNSVDAAISTNGSFYTYILSNRVIIVMPDVRQVVFAYSG